MGAPTGLQLQSAMRSKAQCTVLCDAFLTSTLLPHLSLAFIASRFHTLIHSDPRPACGPSLNPLSRQSRGSAIHSPSPRCAATSELHRWPPVTSLPHLFISYSSTSSPPPLPPPHTSSALRLWQPASVPRSGSWSIRALSREKRGESSDQNDTGAVGWRLE
ncbi:hypothetical protein GJAV_G00216530 [Gymnothorax javanicus]|nr:hypothetical protein GJAV_G00216530 [Gymnothorax javanicus]